MTRLVLAVIVVAVLAAILVVLGLGLRAVFAGAPDQAARSSPVQKVAFALLVALVLYVAFRGGA